MILRVLTSILTTVALPIVVGILFALSILSIVKRFIQGKIIRVGTCVAYDHDKIGIVLETRYLLGQILVSDVPSGRLIYTDVDDVIRKNKGCSKCRYRFECWTGRSKK